MKRTFETYGQSRFLVHIKIDIESMENRGYKGYTKLEIAKYTKELEDQIWSFMAKNFASNCWTLKSNYEKERCWLQGKEASDG